MDPTLKFVIGITYILYGLLKIIIGVSVMTLPTKIIAKIPVLNWFLQVVEDDTVAGRVYEYALMVFGVYTIIHGLALVGILPAGVDDFLDTKYVQYTIYMALGVPLTIFYALVLYTNLPISKDMRFKAYYEWLGLGGGLFFVSIPILWELLEWALPVFRHMSTEALSLSMISTTIVLFLIGERVYSYLKTNNFPIIPREVDIVKTSINQHTHKTEM